MRLVMDTIPIGKRLVGNVERIQTLSDLYDAKTQVVTTLEQFPIMRYDVNRS